MTAGIVTTDKSAQKLSRINELAEQAANELGFVLLGVHIGQQGRNKRLEITIYRKDQPISFLDCEQMSRTLEHLIEGYEGEAALKELETGYSEAEGGVRSRDVRSESVDSRVEPRDEGEAALNNGSSYLLEVISPGTDRQLTSAFEFNLFAGSQVRIVTKEKIASVGIDFIATLIGGDENSVIISHAIPCPVKGTNKSTKAKWQTKVASDSVSVEANNKLTISLQQIYRIYLWSGS